MNNEILITLGMFRGVADAMATCPEDYRMARELLSEPIRTEMKPRHWHCARMSTGWELGYDAVIPPIRRERRVVR